MAQKADDNHTPGGQPASSPIPTALSEREALRSKLARETKAFYDARDRALVTLQQLMRPVAALPRHQFMSLSEAFAQAKSWLRADDLTAHDLWQHARDRRLTVAVRQAMPDGTEQAFILRSAFWRYFRIWPPHSRYREVPQVGGSIEGVFEHILFRGRRWYFFVGHRRFDRLYSVAAPDEPAAPASPKNPRGAGNKRTFDREFILTEAAAYILENDLPAGLDELVTALQLKLGKKMPGDTQGKKILRSFFRRMKQALGR